MNNLRKYGILIASTISIACASGATIAEITPKTLEASNFKEVNDFRLQKFDMALEKHKEHRPKGWDKLVDIVRNQKNDYEKVAMANVIINQIPYKDGTDGSYFWPQKAFDRGAVVCKDYALLKYILLTEAGYPADKLAVVVHRSVIDPANGAHVVLLVNIDGQTWIANQFWQSTASQFNARYKINPQKLSSDLKRLGADALRTDFNPDNAFNKRSLTKVANYSYPQQEILAVLNENGVYKGLSSGLYAKNKR